MAALAAPPPPPDDGQQLVEDALGRALDAGKTGPELLSALHAAAPHLEMAAMHSLLEDYKAKEDAKLFDLVAENYRDFFRIATSVEGSAEDAAATQAALLALEGEASKAAATAGVEQAKLEDELARRREKRREDREKDKVKRFADTLSDLERRLADADVDVERAAHDALHLRAALDGAVDGLRDGDRVSFVQGCRDRVDACALNVAQKIDDEFAATCCRLGKAQGDERLRRVLRAAAALGRGPQLEEFFGERVLDAFVKATYTRGRLDGVERGSRSGLPTMYRATLEFVEERCGAALRACEVAARGVDDDVLGLRGVPGAVEREARKHKRKPPPPGSLLGVDLLCEGVWRRVCAALLETPELSGLFDLGDADAAHRAVAATDSFREGLAAIAGKGDRDAERHARRRLRGHAQTAELEQRWNLPVYVELVRADLIQAVDGALASEEDAAPALIGAVERCWAGDRFLPAVGDAFGALALELAQRGATGLAARAARAEGHDAHARCAVDCGTFSARIRATLASGFEALLDLSLEDAALLAAGCDEALEACDRAVEECRRDAADDLVGVIDGRLAACKGVAARYHLTGQKAPSEPSSYVAHAAEPLAQFYETWSALLGDAQPDRAQVSERCAVHLETRALAVLDHAAQFETVMAKRGNTASLAEDSRKIAAQLELDVRAFCALVGVEYSAMARVSGAIGAVLSAPAG